MASLNRFIIFMIQNHSTSFFCLQVFFIKNIVYSGSKQNVKLTMVAGKILYEDGKFEIGFDPEEIYEKANRIIRRMK